MDYAIYTAGGAASQTLVQQSVTSSNLANANTPGFRSQLLAMRAVPVDGESLQTRTLVTASTPGADMTQGKLNYTGRPLDVALQQDGFLAVQMPDGSEAYTRNGDMQVSPTNQLTVQGHPVMGITARLKFRRILSSRFLRTGPLPCLKPVLTPTPWASSVSSSW